MLTHPANYLLCFFLPLSTSLFFITGLHSLSGALLWTLPCWLLLLAEWLSPKLTVTPAATLPRFYYDAILLTLAFLHLLNVLLMCQYVSQLSWASLNDVLTGITNVIVIRFLLGTCSGISGIVVAHELLHRPAGFLHSVGRLLLCSLCYDHFLITHRHGHHRGVEEHNDFTTARLGESFSTYWRRVYWRHLTYAWAHERRRTQALGPLHNRVLQGMLLEGCSVLLILILYGWVAAGLFLYQAFIAVRILEAINYVQHWGLNEPRYATSFGWVNDVWLTRYLLLGLANHIGHHQDERLPYYRIPYSDQGPRMPYGYLLMNLWAKLHNSSYQQMARQALEQYAGRQTAGSKRPT